MYEFDSKELALIFKVSMSRLKHIVVNELLLNQKLSDNGLVLIGTRISGRKKYYQCEEIDMSWKSLCKKNRIHDYELCADVAVERKRSFDNDISYTQKHIADSVGCHRNTVSKCDKALVNMEFMKKDGYRYYTYDGGSIKETTKEHYSLYIKQHSSQKQSEELITRDYNEGRITLEELNSSMQCIGKSIKTNIVFRVRDYKPGSSMDIILKKIGILHGGN